MIKHLEAQKQLVRKDRIYNAIVPSTFQELQYESRNYVANSSATVDELLSIYCQPFYTIKTLVTHAIFLY